MRPRPPRSRRCCCTGGWSRGGGRSACSPLPVLRSSGRPGTRPTRTRCPARSHDQQRRGRTPRHSRRRSRLDCARGRRSSAWRRRRRGRFRWRSRRRQRRHCPRRSPRSCRHNRGRSRCHLAGRRGTRAERSAASPQDKKVHSRSPPRCRRRRPRRSELRTGPRNRRRSRLGSECRPSSLPPHSYRPSSDENRSRRRRRILRSTPA